MKRALSSGRIGPISASRPTVRPTICPPHQGNPCVYCGEQHAFHPAEGKAGRDGICSECDLHQEEH